MGRLSKLKRELILESNKRVLGEDKLGIEPVIDKSRVPVGYSVFFEEGKDTISDSDKTMAAEHLAKDIMKSLPTIERFMSQGNIPKFITIGSGTSSTGNRDRNAELGRSRMEEMKDIVFMAFDVVGGWTGDYVGKDVIEDLITTKTNSSYKPSDLNPIYDRNRSLPRDMDRYGFLVVRPLTTKGLTSKGIDGVENELIDAKGLNFNPDEDVIRDAIKKLQTYSDIVDLDNELRNQGGLQGFINSTIKDGFTSWGSDTEEREEIRDAINKASKNSGKGTIAKIVGDVISIILD